MSSSEFMNLVHFCQKKNISDSLSDFIFLNNQKNVEFLFFGHERELNSDEDNIYHTTKLKVA